jgi:hypothetical protein
MFTSVNKKDGFVELVLADYLRCIPLVISMVSRLLSEPLRLAAAVLRVCRKHLVKKTQRDKEGKCTEVGG